jgi:hypothetical protein
MVCFQSFPCLEAGGNLKGGMEHGDGHGLSIVPVPRSGRQLTQRHGPNLGLYSFNRSRASKREATPVIYSPYPSSVSVTFLAKITLLQQEKDFSY